MDVYTRRARLIDDFRRQREAREAAIREVEQQALANFAHVGEATEEEIAEQAEHDLAREEAEAELAAMEWEDTQGNGAAEMVRMVQEDMERVIQNLHEEEVEAERQRTLTEQLRAQVTQPEVPQTMTAHMDLREGAITFNPTAEQTQALQEALNNAEPGFIQPVDVPVLERGPFEVQGHIHNARIDNIEGARITAGPITGDHVVRATIGQWEPATFTPPRMYKIDFNKVNSMEDMIKVLKSFYQHYTVNESRVKELKMEHLVDRVDDRG